MGVGIEEPSGPREAAEPDLNPSVRGAIAEIWKNILHTHSVAPNQNFFSLGGDSLSAARMFALLEQKLHFRAGLSDQMKFFESPTLSQLEHIVAGGAPKLKEFQLENVSALEVQAAGAGPPIFFFPGESVDPNYQRHLVSHLGATQPFFVLHHQLSDPTEFDAIADRFVRLIKSIRPEDPVVLAGHCYGGILAYEVSQRLTGRAPSEIAVVLVDVNTPGYPKANAGVPICASCRR